MEQQTNKNSSSTLDKLPVGKEAIISSIECKDKSLRQHILNMGLTPGVEVMLIKAAPMGDPIEIRVRGYDLTLRKKDASAIFIEDIHDSHNIKTHKNIASTAEHTQKGEEQSYLNHPKNKILKKEHISLALVGNQNSGKTTLFNKITGSNQRVGNFPGVTVDKTEADLKGFKNATVTDLPGIYSLSSYSKEEIISRDFILKEKPDAIINIVDATNIERNLLLTMQLIELNIPMVIALNMMDEVEKSNGSIDINGLEQELGIPVLAISAAKNEGINELIQHAVNVAKYEERPTRLDFCDGNNEKLAPVHKCIHSIMHTIEDFCKTRNLPVRFCATKIANSDPLVLKMISADKNIYEICENLVKQMEFETKQDRQAAVANMRFTYIETLCSTYVYKMEETAGYKISAQIDRILTGKYTAIPMFMLIMALIFYFTFGPVGIGLSVLMEKGIGAFCDYSDLALTAYGLNPIVKSLIINGIFAGVGGVLVFLPIIVVLFAFLSVLEDTGYMARVAFVMDKILRKIGLSGRSFVPMLIGFGCSVPAILATRTLPSERDRKMTIFLTPFMSCSAKLPIYALFTAVFFSEYQVLVIISLYVIGIIAGLATALFMKFFIFKDEPTPFVLELPNYRFPSFTSVSKLIYLKAKSFVTKAFTIIFWATIIIWFLQNFDTRLNLVQDSQTSLLAHIGSFLTPVFQPLGIADWKISTAFLTGLIAKESVISTLGVLVGGDITKISELFSRTSAFVFLVFSLLYTPCVAAIATVRKELGKRYAVCVVLIQCLIAWCVAFAVYKILSLI